MHNRGLTLFEILAIVVILFLLAAMLLSNIHGHGHARRQLSCASNLQQLYKLGTVYATSHKGEWPEATGEDLWLTFARTTPPLIPIEHAELLHCTLAEQELGPKETNYRGPVLPWKKLTGGDPLDADREGNHGEGQSINVMFKDGSVLEAAPGDALWKKCRESLSP